MDINLAKDFSEKGFVIDNSDLFLRELRINSIKPSDLLKELVDLEKKAYDNSQFLDFAQTVLDKTKKITTILNDDPNFYLTDSQYVQKFNESIENINNNFVNVKNYLKAEKNMLFQQQNLINVNKKIYELDKSSKENSNRTVDTFKLLNEKKMCQKAYNDAKTIYDKQLNLLNNSFNSKNLGEFKNNLLHEISKLRKTCNNLAVSPTTKENINTIINNMNVETANYAIENINSMNKYETLCKRYGISSNDKNRYRNFSSKPKQTNGDPSDEMTNIEPKAVQTEKLAEENTKDEKKEQNFLKCIKHLAPWALGGAVVGLGASIVVPSVVFSGVGTFRIVYSTAKLVNKVVSKKFLKGKPTIVDKVIDATKVKVAEKYGDTKLYKIAQKLNGLLKKPETQWFLNGLAVGYKIGDALNLHDKVFSSHNTGKLNVDTHVDQPQSSNQSTPIDQTLPQDNVVSQSYDSLNTGENIDLSQVEYGFRDSYSAVNDENNPLHLITKYATKENGTFIKELRLPNGDYFTGNIGDLLEKGVDPNTVAARIVNQNGDYAWLNLQDILDVYKNNVGNVR